MRVLNKYIGHLLLVLLISLLVAGCGSGPADNGGGGAADDPKILTIATPAEPKSVLPTLTDSVWESFFTSQLFVALTEVDYNYNVIPGVAHSWEWDEDSLTYTFYLRDDVYFHDGRQLTAEDVIWTFKYAMHPDYEGTFFQYLQSIRGAADYREGRADDVEGLSAPDPFTVQVTLAEKDASFLLYGGSSVYIMPKHYYEPFVEENGVKALRGSERTLPPVGAGPFRWKEWRPGQWIVLTKNEDFFREEPEVEGQTAQARLDEVRVRFIPDSDAMYQALKAGDIDLMDGLTADQFLDALEDPELQAHQYPYLYYYQFMFNFRDPKFQDVRVRRAIGHAMNRDQMVETVLQGLGTVASGGHTHPIRWDYTDEFTQLHPQYDPDRAIALMEEAGWTIEKDDQGNIVPGAVWTKDGQEFEFEIVTIHEDKVRTDFQQLIQRDLNSLGFRVSLLALESNTFYNDYLVKEPWQTAIAAWRLGGDPGGGYELIFGCTRTPAQNGYNWLHYCSEGGVIEEKPGRLTELDQAGREEMDPDRRMEIYREANEILLRDLPYIWLAYPDGLLAAKRELQGIAPVHPSAWYTNLWRLAW